MTPVTLPTTLLSSNYRCGDVLFTCCLRQERPQASLDDLASIGCLLEEGAVGELPLISKLGITHSYCWRWFVEQLSDKPSVVSIDCFSTVDSKPCKTSFSSGELLEAVEIEAAALSIHMGTEDTDAHWSRAQHADWMPVRLESLLGNHRKRVVNWVAAIPGGLRIQLPELRQHERIYFHFAVAAKSNVAGGEIPPDTSTWMAVDCRKQELDRLSWSKVTRL